MTLSKLMQNKIMALGFRIEGTAKRYCPVDTGFMRNKMFSEFDKSTGVLTVGNRARYSKFVEFGNAKMIAAHGEHNPKNPVVQWAAKTLRGASGNQQMPFLRPAIHEELVLFAEELKKSIKLKVKVVIA